MILETLNLELDDILTKKEISTENVNVDEIISSFNSKNSGITISAIAEFYLENEDKKV